MSLPDWMYNALKVVQGGTFSFSGQVLSGFQACFKSGICLDATLSGIAGYFSGLTNDGILSGTRATFQSGVDTQAFSGNIADFSGIVVDIISGFRSTFSSGVVTPAISGLLSIQMSGAISGRVATSDTSGNATWQAVTAAATINIKQTEINWGDGNFQTEKTFTITDADVSATSQILASIANEAVSGKDADENEVDSFVLIAKPAAGTFDLFIKSLEGSVYGGYLVNYLVG